MAEGAQETFHWNWEWSGLSIYDGDSLHSQFQWKVSYAPNAFDIIAGTLVYAPAIISNALGA